MGKIIKSKIRGMSLWVKAGLVLSLTLIVSVFLFQGLYQPKTSQADYQSMLHNSNNLGTAKGVWGVTGGRYGAFTCATCHSATASGTNIKRIRTAITASGFTAWSSTGTATLNVAFTNTTSMGTLTVGSGTSAQHICEMCHAKTAYHRYNYVTSNTHGSQGVEGDCTKCHPHNVGFKPTGGSCTGCHKVGGQGNVNGRAAIVEQFDTAGNSHHNQPATGTVTPVVCYACHWEANSDGTINSSYHQKGKVALAVYTATRASATVVSYSSGRATASVRSELVKINNVCLGCHSSTNPNFKPFGDGMSPRTYSWEAKPTSAGGFGAAQSIASKYLQTTTTTWGKYNTTVTNARNTVIKSFGGHADTTGNHRGWSTIPENSQMPTAVANYPDSGASSNILCFDCHNSHGSKTATSGANAFTTSYSSATGRYKGGLLKDTTAGQGGYANTYRSYTGGNGTQHNVRSAGASLCFDCHNNASAGATTSTGYTSPWGYQGTFGATQGIWGYNDSPYFGKAAGVFAKGISFPYLATITTNKGGHLGASSTLTYQPSRKINGVCTNCHDPHGVTPALGTNQQYAVPMLKNTFVTSPYKQDFANPNVAIGGGSAIGQIAATSGGLAGYHIDMNTLQAPTAGTTGTPPQTAYRWDFMSRANTLQTLVDTQFAGLCLGCHSKANINTTDTASSTNWRTLGRVHNTVNGWASTGGGNTGNTVHAYTCSKCHTPHNSYLPRLLVTNCLDVKHKGQVISGGSMPVALTLSTSSGNGLGRFPGGGGAAASSSRATASGPWFFGTSGVAATRTCHDSTTAGGAFTGTGAEQLWNTKSTW